MNSQNDSRQVNPKFHDPVRRGVPSRNPLPLSATQEGEVKEVYYKNVRAKCAAEIKKFAECATGRTITATWICRAQRLAMNGCMISYATLEEQDRAREEWFASREDRRKQKEKEAAEHEAKLKLKRDFWGVNEEGRLLDRDKRVDTIRLEQAQAFRGRGK